MSQCPSHTRYSQLHKLYLLSVTLIFSPLVMLLITLCHGLIYDCPFSKDTPHPPIPLGRLWCMRNTQAELPGRGCHPPSAPVSTWDRTVFPSQPLSSAGCLPPVCSADSPECHSFRVTLYSPSQGKPKIFRQNQLLLQGLMFPHQPAPCRVIESMVWVGP